MNIRTIRIAQALLALAAALAFIGIVPGPHLPMLYSAWGMRPAMFSALLPLAAITSLQLTFWKFDDLGPSVRRIRWSYRAFSVIMVAALVGGLSNCWFAASNASYYGSEKLIHESQIWASIGWWTAAPTMVEAATALGLLAVTVCARVRRPDPTVEAATV